MNGAEQAVQSGGTDWGLVVAVASLVVGLSGAFGFVLQRRDYWQTVAYAWASFSWAGP